MCQIVWLLKPALDIIFLNNNKYTRSYSATHYFFKRCVKDWRNLLAIIDNLKKKKRSWVKILLLRQNIKTYPLELYHCRYQLCFLLLSAEKLLVHPSLVPCWFNLLVNSISLAVFPRCVFLQPFRLSQSAPISLLSSHGRKRSLQFAYST